jgi:hypothetical protein
MNTEELTILLTRIQVLDNRQVDALTIQAWTPLMANVSYADAVAAVNDHYSTTTDYLQPAHITQGVARRKRLALPETMSPEAPEDCGKHRWLADGTCLYCITRRESHEPH